MNINLSQLDKARTYKLFTHAIVPRPIAWVLTENENGSYNVAPFSYFNVVCSEPPLMMFSAGKKRDGSKKDTWANIERTGQCVIHIVGDVLAGPLNESARTLAAGESEVEHIDQDLITDAGFELPRLDAAPIAFDCKLYDIHELGDGPQAIIYCQATAAYLDDAILDADTKLVDPLKLRPLARLGGESYARQGEVFDLKRPS
ncbi:flavin reductase family protein [Reinekea marinisedimentorum]|uniref:Flavin reductase (DIM6/NTAB) family NADH-FMN oxidoreductase RutF n=1 Tax=Reinekea marinisedimentorum TaxID=230495 RepID=A0A4V2UJQ3_9GAMM|nr:flavin reductase family protein [Reinekea marinisedimentorum]TCS41016.1 flavin reductase (DIM6/NTAB) family NADH-FMN oxidoreductase RutF [Reinekea marinisedimentorum]